MIPSSSPSMKGFSIVPIPLRTQWNIDTSFYTDITATPSEAPSDDPSRDQYDICQFSILPYAITRHSPICHASWRCDAVHHVTADV